MITCTLAEEIDFYIGHFRTYQIFMTFSPWPWTGSDGILSCITHRPLPTHQISFKSEKHFVDKRTLRPAVLGRLMRSRP